MNTPFLAVNTFLTETLLCEKYDEYCKKGGKGQTVQLFKQWFEVHPDYITIFPVLYNKYQRDVQAQKAACDELFKAIFG